MEVIGIIILALVLYFSLFHSPNNESQINDNNHSSDNQKGFLFKKRINEHIKLILQNTYAATFFLEDAKINGNAREQGDAYGLFQEILKIHDSFLQRDLTYDEVDYLLEKNMFFRRCWDAANLKSVVGKFENVISPSIAEDRKTWDMVIDEFKEKMVWIKENEDKKELMNDVTVENNLYFKSNEAAFEYALQNPHTINIFLNTALVTKKIGDGNYELIVNIDGEKHIKIANADKGINYEEGDFVTLGHDFKGIKYWILNKLKPELDIERNYWVSDK